jgi:hypothetical protein
MDRRRRRIAVLMVDALNDVLKLPPYVFALTILAFQGGSPGNQFYFLRIQPLRDGVPAAGVMRVAHWGEGNQSYWLTI